MKAKNIPTSFTVVHKETYDAAKKEQLDIVIAKLFMDYIKKNPDFFKYDDSKLPK